MSAEGKCPVCGAGQIENITCHSCTLRFEHLLGDVPSLVRELETTISKQAKVGNPSSGGGGLARERNPINWGAVEVSDNLANVLTTWARDVSGDRFSGASYPDGAHKPAARLLLSRIDTVRRHPAVAELVDEVTDAVEQARRVVDRPGNRTIIFVGPCPEPDEYDRPCMGEVHAYIPIEDDRPSRMQCKYNGEHQWDSTQWLRAGKRIADLAEEQRRTA